MLKLRKNKKGFTLVELIVVIAIMAVLAGTIAGVTVSQLNKQTDKTAYGDIATLATALDAYLSGEDVDATNFKDKVSAWITEYNTEHNSALKTTGDAPKAGTHSFLVAVSTETNKNEVTFSFSPKTSSSKHSRVYEYNANTHSITEKAS